MPNCAKTGIPARVTAVTASRWSAAPSSFTMSTPASFTSRIAARTALLRALLHRPEREVAAEQCARHPSADRLAHDDHLIHRHLEWVRLAPQVDSDGVTHRNHFHACTIDDPRHLVVPCHHADDLAAARFIAARSANCTFLPTELLHARNATEQIDHVVLVGADHQHPGVRPDRRDRRTRPGPAHR